jgi:hypothetical protein
MCGAVIRLSVSAAGKRARCKTCSKVFTVPEALPAPTEANPELATADARAENGETGGAGGWLRRVYEGLRPDPDGEADAESPEGDGAVRDACIRKRFWSDLAASVLVPLRGWNIIIFAVLLLAHALMAWLPTDYPHHHWGYHRGVGPEILEILRFTLAGVLAAIYLRTVLDAASGTDKLSISSDEAPVGLNLGRSERLLDWSFEDKALINLLAQGLGTAAYVFLPALIVMFIRDVHLAGGRGIPLFVREVSRLQIAPDPLVRTFVGLGFALWPSVILMVAIGGTIRELWPHLVLRTALAAPLAYLAVTSVCLLPCVLLSFAFSPSGVALLSGVPGPVIRGTHWLPIVLLPYSILVATHAIGLYYRYYKERFPWAAE